VAFTFEDPNVTLLVEQGAETVARDEELIQDKIKDMLEVRISATNAAVWPAKSSDVPDKEPKFLIGYLPLSLTIQTKHGEQATAKDFSRTTATNCAAFATASRWPFRTKNKSRSCGEPCATCLPSSASAPAGGYVHYTIADVGPLGAGSR
jgi:hypothetical protein